MKENVKKEGEEGSKLDLLGVEDELTWEEHLKKVNGNGNGTGIFNIIVSFIFLGIYC